MVVRISYAPHHAISCGFPSCSCLGICTVNRETETVLCPMSAGSDIVRDLCQPSPPTHMHCFAAIMHASLCRTARGTFDGRTYRTPAVEMIASSGGHVRFEHRIPLLRGFRNTSEQTYILPRIRSLCRLCRWCSLVLVLFTFILADVPGNVSSRDLLGGCPP